MTRKDESVCYWSLSLQCVCSFLSVIHTNLFKTHTEKWKFTFRDMYVSTYFKTFLSKYKSLSIFSLKKHFKIILSLVGVGYGLSCEHLGSAKASRSVNSNPHINPDPVRSVHLCNWQMLNSGIPDGEIFYDLCLNSFLKQCSAMHIYSEVNSTSSHD